MSILDRQQYALNLKKAIEVGQQLKDAMEGLGMDLTSVKNDLKILKDKLTNFDVYNQKSPYDNRCSVCREEVCVCCEIEPKVEKNDEITKEELNKLF